MLYLCGMFKWLFKYYWGMILVVLPAIICTAFPFYIFYLGTPEMGINRWNTSPLDVIFGRFLLTFIPTFIITLIIISSAFLFRRFMIKDKKNSTLLLFGKSLLFFTIFIILLIFIFMAVEYYKDGYIV